MIKIFMSGPIRPSEENVVNCINNIRKIDDETELFFSTWNIDSKIIRKKVDHYIMKDEPTDIFIKSIVNERTKQIKRLMDNKNYNPKTDPNKIYNSTKNTTKMFIGIKNIFDYVKNISIKNDDIIIRIRTDLNITFNIDIMDFVKDINNKYYNFNWISSGVAFSDWIGISTYSNMKKIWYYDYIDEKNSTSNIKFNNDLKNSYNTEEIIKKNVLNNNLKIEFFNKYVNSIEIIR